VKDKIRNNIITIAGFGLGMIGGFLYWKYIGCASGTCPITSSWKIMPVYGGVVGGLLGNMVQEVIRKYKTKKAD
jgi:phosphate/sulfate permease